MKTEHLHNWNVDCNRAREIQNELRSKLTLHNEDLPDKVKTISHPILEGFSPIPREGQ